MEKQILNTILKKSNLGAADYHDELMSGLISLITASLFFIMIAIFCILNDFFVFSILFGILFFSFLLMVVLMIIDWIELTKLKNIYNKYPEIFIFLYQNKHQFKEIDIKKIIHYNFSQNYHYIRYIIQNHNFKKLKEIMPIFNEENTKFIVFNNKSYNIDSKINLKQIQSIIDDINNLITQFPKIKYPEYTYSEINENKLKDYYNLLLKISYQKV